MGFLDAAVASNCHVDRPTFVGLQHERIGSDFGGEPLWRWIKQQCRATAISIETQVIQCNLGIASHLRRHRPTALAAQSPHLEQIGKVASEGEHKPDVERFLTVILHAQALIDGAAPKKSVRTTCRTSFGSTSF